MAAITKIQKMIVAVNENGNRIGEKHHRSKLTDHEVELIRTLFDDGMRVSEIARKFEIAKAHCWDICHYLVRCQTVAEFREVNVVIQMEDNSDMNEREEQE